MSGSSGAIQHEIATDLFMAFGMRRWAEYQAVADADTYLYFMTHDTPAFHLYMSDSDTLSLPGGPRSAGAYHSGDLAFVFGSMDKVGTDWNDADRELSRTMAIGQALLDWVSKWRGSARLAGLRQAESCDPTYAVS